jgi:hypothetical protein
MKIALNIIGGLLILAGGVWFLQGINILPGSFMTGDPQWSINGGIAMVLGAGLLWFANRGKDSRKKKND